jgi:membrane protease YdiL (CAAX protease family)/transcription elongation factor Elf1
MSLVVVETCTYLWQADSIKSMLEDHGIESFIQNANTIAMDWALGQAIGGVQVAVATKDATEALALIEAHRANVKQKYQASNFEIRFNCDECNKPLSIDANRAGGLEHCPHCHAYIDIPERTSENCFEVNTDTATQTTEGNNSTESTSSTRIERHKHRSKPFQYLACFVVLYFCWYPDFASGLEAYKFELSTPMFADYVPAYLIQRSLMAIFTVLAAAVLSGWKLAELGLVRFRWRDIGIGIGIFVGVLILFAFAAIFSFGNSNNQQYGFSEDGSGLENPWRFFAWMTVALILNSFAEELAMRGYLIPWLREQFKSKILAVIVSAAFFASYHIYQGLFEMSLIFLIGLAFGWYFVNSNRIWPVILAHTLINLSSYIQVAISSTEEVTQVSLDSIQYLLVCLSSVNVVGT